MPASDPFAFLPRFAQRQAHAGAALQVLARRLTVRRLESGGLRFVVAIDEEDGIITGSADRRRVAAALDAEEGRALEERIARLRATGAVGEEIAVRTERFGFRHVSAGAFPIVGRDALLFLRDLPPAGWNVANGASAGDGELLDPIALGRREAAEELLFHVPSQGCLLALESSAPPREALLARRLWAERLGTSAPVAPLAARPRRSGLDRIDVCLPDGRTRRSEGLMVEVQAEDFSIECVRVLELDLPADAVPLDGELAGATLLDRVVARVPLTELKSSAATAARAWRGGHPLAGQVAGPLCPITANVARRLPADAGAPG